MMIKQLTHLDLTPNQATVYTTLAKRGMSRAGEIIAETSLHRTIVYRALRDLIRRRLAFRVTQRGVFHYTITNPHTLVTEYEQKEKLAETVAQELAALNTSHQEMTILYGKEGLTDHFTTHLESSDAVRVIGAQNEVVRKYPGAYERYQAHRQKKRPVNAGPCLRVTTKCR